MPDRNRLIFHIDVNSAFLSWTALERLAQGDSVDLRTIPAIVGGDTSTRHGVVLAKSIPAKAFGITTGEPVVNALRKCPHLVMASPDHSMYREKSRLLMEHLSGICPDIEQVSIDECYMDYSPIAAQYSSPEAAAAYIRDSVREKFHFTVNVGISDRKVLAKMASDFQKPDKTHTLYQEEIPEKMWPLPVSTLFTCGHSSAETLRKLGILTIGDLAKTDPVILESHLKSHGRSLWKYANGIDDSVVALVPSKAKGIGNSTTLSSDALTEEDARKVLLSLCESVGQRLRSSHQLEARYVLRSATAIFAMFLTRCPWPSLPPLRICCWKAPFPYSTNCGTELPSGCWVYAPPSWYPRMNRSSSVCLITPHHALRNNRSWMLLWMIFVQNTERML